MCVYIYIYVYMCVFVCVYMYEYIYTPFIYLFMLSSDQLVFVVFQTWKVQGALSKISTLNIVEGCFSIF